MEIKNIQTDQDFQKVMDSVNKYIDSINKYQEDNPHLVQPTAMELAQFHKSHFYHNWLHRYRKLFAFGPLGNHGVIAIPNTTFEEWLYWFSEWAEAFMDDYNAFKKLVFEALLLIEKHLEAIDAELQNHEGRITANEAHLADHDAQLVDHQNHLERLDKGLADETKARQDADNAEKNARIAKDNDLQNQINAEKGARESKDNDLQNQINAETQARKDADNVEKAAREQADNELGNRITVVDNKVNNISKVVLSYENTYWLDRSKIELKNGLTGENVPIKSWTPQWTNNGYNPTGAVNCSYEPLDIDGDGSPEYYRVQIGIFWLGWVNKRINDFPTRYGDTASPSKEIAIFDLSQYGNFVQAEVSTTGDIFGHYQHIGGSEDVTRTGFYSIHVENSKISFGINYLDGYSSDWSSNMYFNGNKTIFLKKVG